MISISESFLISDGSSHIHYLEEPTTHLMGPSFSPPAEALMSVLRTPGLEISERYDSPDYLEHRIASSRGFAPEESIHTEKFKI